MLQHSIGGFVHVHVGLGRHVLLFMCKIHSLRAVVHICVLIKAANVCLFLHHKRGFPVQNRVGQPVTDFDQSSFSNQVCLRTLGVENFVKKISR